jgi:aryl-alcohol dehydrogenase-like predicted oxidoreductase
MIVKVWGSWDLFQSLLLVLRQIGDHHGRSISNIATRWVLDQPCVGAVLIGRPSSRITNDDRFSRLCSGARLGISEHIDDNRLAFGFHLTKQDHAAIEEILSRSQGSHMLTTIGDCGAEYRS